MSTQDKAREVMAQERKQENHLHETMVSRATDSQTTATPELDEKARELLTSDRQHVEHLEETMLSRSVEH
ncbi:MAG: hypothetical protein VKJ02_08850 [Snowella sp.]|nr:hypothetical protein [Snowella sp.]